MLAAKRTRVHWSLEKAHTHFCLLCHSTGLFLTNYFWYVSLNHYIRVHFLLCMKFHCLTTPQLVAIGIFYFKIYIAPNKRTRNISVCIYFKKLWTYILGWAHTRSALTPPSSMFSPLPFVPLLLYIISCLLFYVYIHNSIQNLEPTKRPSVFLNWPLLVASIKKKKLICLIISVYVHVWVPKEGQKRAQDPLELGW